MAKRRNENAISLFPFLAVLVCTMGALILLLLVTTRRIRQKQTETTRRAVTQPIDSAPPVDELPESQGSLTDFGITAEAWTRAQMDLALATQQQSAAEQALEDQQKRRADADLKHKQQQQQLLTLRKELKAEQERHRTTLSGLKVKQQQLADLKEQQEIREQQISHLKQAVSDSTEELASAESLAESAEQLVGRRHSALQTLRDLSMSQHDQDADSGTPETLIEFSNAAGTSRTPIIIDLNGSGFLFPATEITIRRDDMEGASAIDNPLLSGVLAVHRQRTSDSVVSRPYVLLLVRPSGTLDFYLAQRVLKSAGIHFGYELIDDDELIAAAEPSMGESEALRSALLSSIKRQGQFRNETAVIRRQIAALREAQRKQRAGTGFDRQSRWPAAQNPDSTNSPADRDSKNPPFDSTDLSEYFGGKPATESQNSGQRLTHSETNGVRGYDETSRVVDQRPRSASADNWKSIPSKAEAQSHVEQELFRALAERDRAKTSKTRSPSGNLNADRSSQLPNADGRLTQNEHHTDNIAPRSTPSSIAPGDLSQTVQVEDFGPTNQDTDAQLSANQSTGQSFNSSQPVRHPNQGGQTTHPHETSPGAAAMSGPGGQTLSAGGSASSSGLVSYRQITIYLDPQHYTVVGDEPVALHGQPISQIIQSLSGRLYELSRQHAHPLSDVTLPSAKFVVSPGAHTLYLQLAADLYDMGIPVSSLVTMDAHVTDASTSIKSILGTSQPAQTHPVSRRRQLP